MRGEGNSSRVVAYSSRAVNCDVRRLQATELAAPCRKPAAFNSEERELNAKFVEMADRNVRRRNHLNSGGLTVVGLAASPSALAHPASLDRNSQTNSQLIILPTDPPDVVALKRNHGKPVVVPDVAHMTPSSLGMPTEVTPLFQDDAVCAQAPATFNPLNATADQLHYYGLPARASGESLSHI